MRQLREQSGCRRKKVVVKVAVGVAIGLVATPVAAGTGRVRYVTDGDTFRLESGERIRIAGVDAPETHADQARCASEIRLGQAAAATVRRLLDGRFVTFVRLGRSYNRTVARVRVGDQDLATILIKAGAARPWPRRRPKPDWCARRRG